MDRRVRGLFVVAAMAIGLYVAGLAWVGRPESGFHRFWDGWLYIAAMAAVVAILAVRVVVERRHRLSWALILAGCTSTFLADLVYLYRDQNLEVFGFPTPSDLLYLAAYPLWAAGVVRLAFHRTNDVPASAMLDGFAVGLTVAAFAVIAWIQPIMDQSGDAADVQAAVSFALLDLVLMVVALSSLAAYRYRPSPAAGLVIIGALLFGLGDLIYLSTTSDGSGASGVLHEAAWLLGMFAYAGGAWSPHRRHRLSHPDQPQPVSAGVVPALAAMLALFVVGAALADEVSTLAAVLAMAAIALALGRVLWSMRELRLANESFRLARTDDLTGLANRRAFLETVDAMLAGPDRPIQVLMLDLDGFKEVNDSLGHQAGDRLLRVVADRLAEHHHRGQFLARLGGDEFGLASSSSRFDAEATAMECAALISAPIDLDGLPIRISASIGLASGDHATREDLLRMADVAMYEAKRRGLAFAYYDEDRDPHGRERLQLIDDLRHAVERGDLRLHYQPLMAAADGSVVAVEALVRWCQPDGTDVPPSVFVPLAEQIGLVPQVTRSVVTQAVLAASQLRSAGHHLVVHVNVSAKDLVDDELARHLIDSLAAHAVPASALMLEITETALAEDPARSERTLQLVRAEGVQVAVDDFGVGYSSLTSLLELPVDQIKLDHSFIVGLEDDHRAQAIVRSTVELARALRLTLVAEGIESAAVLDWVREQGVDFVQGFHLQRPLPFGPLMSFLDAQGRAGRVQAMSDAPLVAAPRAVRTSETPG